MNISRYIKLVLVIAGLSVPVQQMNSQGSEKMLDLILEYAEIGYRNVNYNINLDTAEYYLKKALQLQYTEPGYEIDDRVAINHINIASVYRRLHNNGEAYYHLNRAEEILKDVDPDSYLFGTIYNNKGNLIKSNSDIYRTKEYYEYALEWLIQTGNRNTNHYLSVYSNYIDILFELQEYDLALEKLDQIEIEGLSLSPDLEFDFYLMKGTRFAMFGREEEAMRNYDKAYRLIAENNLDQAIYKTYKYYYELISFYIERGHNQKALSEISNALVFVESLGLYSKNLKTTYFSTFQYFHAHILNDERNYEKSLAIIDEVMQELRGFFDEQSFTAINSKIRNENSSLLPELFILKSRVLYNLYKTNNSIETLKESSLAYEHSIDILNSTKISMKIEESKFLATAAIIEVYKEAIFVGKLLYDLTGELSFLESAFKFTESSKSFALFSEIKDVEAMEFADLPADLRMQEQNLIGQIQGYEEMLFKEELSLEPDSSRISYFKEKLFHLKDDYNDLLQSIEENNQQYFELKYNPEFVSLQEVQEKLHYRDALIEYVLTDTMLITYVIDRRGINVFSQKIDPGFEEECIEFYQIHHAQNFSEGVHDTYKRFVQLGRKFYSILIEPCLEYTDRKNLTIVPDGAITYLPFEGFLTKESDAEYINYLVLPYLIKEFSVGYSHSATLLFNERLKTKSPENKVLAFAPEYKDVLGYNRPEDIRQVISDREVLLPLNGIIKEVQSINEAVPSRIFLNEEATEANFKKHAPDYNVLHLAMHTIMKDDNPLNSLLAFTNLESADTVEDNRLYAYEIYNLKLNAQMAVLSSCSSGFGKMQKGEGMMSLARGFFYAGCPSIVMTLWQVSDRSSSDLMTSFYKYLKKGKSKQEAMRMAKLDYLETANDLTSNPYFWSGFVVLGDSSPVYRKSGMVYYISIIILFFGILFYFQYKRS